ncbi:hypothetical protein DRQ33_05820 [bacterium]|nr:MAG: hypothetical protein DRQ33_05820 [bacterium]
MKIINKIIAFCVLLMWMVAIGIGCNCSDKTDSEQKKYIRLPEFEYTAPDGRTIDHNPFYNGVGIISFVASWCGPCIFELKQLDSLSRSNDKIYILAVSYEPPEFYKSIFDSLNINIPLAGVDSTFFKMCEVKNLPTRILVDNGKIIARVAGAPTPPDSLFESALEKLVSENSK